VKVLLLAMVMLLTSCIQCPPRDVYWLDSHTQRIRVCPKGAFDEKNRGKLWWTKEGMDNLIERYNMERRGKGIRQKDKNSVPMM